MDSSSTSSIIKSVYRTKCDCGNQLQFSVSRTDKNTGRKFKACHNYKFDTKELEFYANEREPYNEIVDNGVLQVIMLLKFVLVMLMIIGLW
uniref:Uncharacterized protein n=1 Tax=Lactuca sativa TaxID=4236 RepID=A0A9R1VUP0_LACSA|nr:hypothetical protein LSAT_V11C400171600 [Lactuca sativa]